MEMSEVAVHIVGKGFSHVLSSGFPCGKNVKLDLYLKPFMKIYPRWKRELNGKSKALKLFEKQVL